MADIQKFQGFTFSHSEVSGNRIDRPAVEIKALFDSRGNELMEFINKIIDILNSIDAANSIGAKDFDGTKKTIQSIVDKLNNGLDLTNTDINNLDVAFSGLGAAMNNSITDLRSELDKLKDKFKDLIINAGSSNAEVVEARQDNFTGKSFKTIGERMNDLSKTKANIIVCSEIPQVTEKNTFYFKVTKTQSLSGGSENVKISPSMGLKIL